MTFGDDLESQPDPFTDLLVGRLPARTIDEARLLVDEKLIPFLNGPEPGEWRQRILLCRACFLGFLCLLCRHFQ